MQYKPREPGIEVLGATVVAFLTGFQHFPHVASRYLSKFGIVPPGKDLSAVEPTKWYPQAAVLATYEAIANEIGGNTLYGLGAQMVRATPVPPEVRDLAAVLRYLDAGYHLHHRKNGVVMFDPATGRQLEGIGHYAYKRQGDERKILVVCDNPYPCDFDRGIVTALVTRFEPRGTAVHDEQSPCRKRGGDSCTFVVKW